MASWMLLNILAWTVGLKAIYDLRAEHAPHARTWALLAWALWFCLAMEIAMAGAGFAPGLWLLSVTTGIVSAALLAGGVGSLISDLRQGTDSVGPHWLNRAIAGLLLGLAAMTGISTAIAPTSALSVANMLQPFEGAAWIVTSAALVPLLLRGRYQDWHKRVFRPQHLALAFVFSLLGAVLTPMAWLLGVRPPPEVGLLLSTLFVLTLVTTLYAMVIRLRGHRLATALAQVHDYEQQLLVAEKIAAVGTLAAGAAHDFNNVLTVIAGHAELALDHPGLPHDARSDIEHIQVAAQSAQGIAAGLLGVVRRPGGGATPRDVCDAVTKPLDMLGREFEQRGIRVVTNLERNLPTVMIDMAVLSQVCLNLYLNARDAMLPTQGGRSPCRPSRTSEW